MEKLKQMHLTTSLSHHNCQASCTSALSLLRMVRCFFHAYIWQGSHHMVRSCHIF